MSDTDTIREALSDSRHPRRIPAREALTRLEARAAQAERLRDALRRITVGVDCTLKGTVASKHVGTFCAHHVAAAALAETAPETDGP